LGTFSDPPFYDCKLTAQGFGPIYLTDKRGTIITSMENVDTIEKNLTVTFSATYEGPVSDLQLMELKPVPPPVCKPAPPSVSPDFKPMPPTDPPQAELKPAQFLLCATCLGEKRETIVTSMENVDTIEKNLTVTFSATCEGPVSNLQVLELKPGFPPPNLKPAPPMVMSADLPPIELKPAPPPIPLHDFKPIPSPDPPDPPPASNLTSLATYFFDQDLSSTRPLSHSCPAAARFRSA
jgi:hypothetical protein